jgi:hypothetical protein
MNSKGATFQSEGYKTARFSEGVDAKESSISRRNMQERSVSIT